MGRHQKQCTTADSLGFTHAQRAVRAQYINSAELSLSSGGIDGKRPPSRGMLSRPTRPGRVVFDKTTARTMNAQAAVAAQVCGRLSSLSENRVTDLGCGLLHVVRLGILTYPPGRAALLAVIRCPPPPPSGEAGTLVCRWPCKPGRLWVDGRTDASTLRGPRLRQEWPTGRMVPW